MIESQLDCRFGCQPVITNETAGDALITPSADCYWHLTDLVLGPCPHNLRDLRVRLGMDRHLFAVVWYKKNGSQLLVVEQMK